MKNLFESALVWLKKNKKIFFALLMLFVAAGVFILADSALAQAGAAKGDVDAGGEVKIGSFLSVVISTVCSWITWALGLILGILMHLVIGVAQYNDFINSGAVTNGWVIIRDICNMFFILILLVIAFSVILRVDGYDIKKMIPKLLIMAVLINFSKTICGLIIDAAQVIMGTFVTSFKGVGGASMVQMFGMNNYLSFDKGDQEVKDLTASVAIGYFVAIIFLLISLVVVVALLGVLVMRMIMIWVYVVLSPLAFFLASFPQGKSYSQRWWKEFTEAVIVGPVLAFFLWLAFVTLGPEGSGSGVELGKSTNAPAGPTAAFNADNILKYVISIGMLIGGLVISQSMAGAAGGMAGKAMGKIQAGAGWTKKKALGGAKAVGLFAGGAALGAGKTLGGAVDRYGGRLAGAGLNLGKGLGSKGVGGAIGRGMVSAGAALGAGGLIATPLIALKNAPEKIWNNITKGDAEKRQIQKNIARGTTSSDGSFTHEGSRYRWNDKKNAYQQVDEKNPKIFKKGAGTTLQYKGKDVKKMGAWGASWTESREAAGSASKGAANAAQSKKINEEMEGIKNSGMGNEEAMRLLNNFSTSAPKKMALAMFLAANKAFKNKAEKDNAERVLANNSVLSSKFNDDVVKNQPHLAYDLKAIGKNGKVDVDLQAREEARFKKDLSKGKIDVSNLHKDAINDKLFQAQLRAWAKDPQTGSEEKYARIMEKNAENGGGENSKDVAAMVKSQIGKDANGKPVAIKDDASARLFAKMTGDLKGAFADAKGNFNAAALDAMGKYLATSSPKDLSRINPADIKNIVTNDPKAAEIIAFNLKFTTMKSLAKNAETSNLASVLREVVDDVATSPSPSPNNLNQAGIDKIQTLSNKIDKDPDLQDI